MGRHRYSVRGARGAGSLDGAAGSGLGAHALSEFLAEEVIVHARDGSVKQRLGPPNGFFNDPATTENLLSETCHPDDVDALAELAAAAIGSEPGWTGSARLRLQHEDGSWRWCESRIWNRHGIAPHDGLVTSVRELFGLDGESADVHADLRDLIPTAAEAAWVSSLLIDRSLIIRHSTPSAARMLGIERAELTDQPLRDVVIEEDLVHLVSGVLGLSPGGERVVVARFQGPGGSEVVAEVRLLRGERTSLDLITAVLTDRTDQAALVRLATIDPLTGLANRVRVMEALEGHLAQGTPVAVIYADVDGLKPLNDTHGHAVGDQLLVEVAHRMTAVIGPGPLIGRMGGDEFLVVCHGSYAAVAPELAERLRSEIRIETFDADIPATVSAGWAETGPDESAAALLHRADAAMFVHKRDLSRNGRPGGPASSPAQK